jgi:hypothetical protein
MSENSCITSIEIGSTIFGATGKGLKVDRIEGDLLVCGDRLIKFSAVLRVENPLPREPPTPDRTPKIGDRLRRKPAPKNRYPKKWHEGETDNRPTTCGPIASATITKFSDSGFWVLTPDQKRFHISHESLEDGVWEAIETNGQNNN